MITQERLKELIEQEGSAWYIKNNKVKQGWFVKNGSYFGFRDENHISVNAKEYYETKEEAEWKKNTYHQRTENFEPLYYDHIDQNYCYDYYFSCKNHHEYLIRVSGKDIILFWLNCSYKEYFKNTKEEYQKVIDRCLKLFLGEENGEI